ncbi:hypothetical protein MBLNU457_4017t1 [Dothideomycetes sp. NU457]
MPDKPLTIATYAAGASLAAITLVYVFGPTFFLDDDAAQSSRSTRKKGVVGLHNPANDCFMNSVLQTLAGLPELRIYLIRELHRRRLEHDIYMTITQEELSNEEQDEKVKKLPEWKALGLQKGLVTAALKEVLDALNERPIYKKTISAGTFISVLEQAFRTRINRNQQDAQEFLQLVTERLSDEYGAAKRVRRKASRRVLGRIEELEKSEETIRPRKEPGAGNDTDTSTTGGEEPIADTPPQDEEKRSDTPLQKKAEALIEEDETDAGFPFEGKIESQIECTHCHFKPKPSVSDFVTLTLHVPQQGKATTLNACFDGMLKVEHIDDFRCERCRLEHAIEIKQKEFSRAPAEKKASIENDISLLQHAMTTDPEKPPKDVTLPDVSLAPRRKIARHMRISTFPRVLAIHLSRSVFDTHSSATKNLAKVSFPETLPLGGLLDQVTYRLLGVVTHKGGHNSGHYESFRRQVLAEPFSTQASLGTEGLYSVKNSPRDSSFPSPTLRPQPSKNPTVDSSETTSLSSGSSLRKPNESSTSLSSGSSRSTHTLGKSKLIHAEHAEIAEDVVTSTSSLGQEEAESPTISKKTSPSSSRGKFDLSRLRPASIMSGRSGSATAPEAGRDLSSPRLSPRKVSDQSFMASAGKNSKAKKLHNRWWRISDDKVKEAKTGDVLGMQREVYLLFYEIVR